MTVSQGPEAVLLARSVKGVGANYKPARVSVEHEARERWSRSISAGVYVLSSLAMTSLTKYAASAWQFPGSSLLLLIECWATVAALAIFRGGYQPWSWKVLRHLPAATIAKALNMYLSFIAMRRTSLPVYNILKRLQPVYAMIQDRFIRGTCPDYMECMGVVLISAGTIVTGFGDLDFDLSGYMLALSAAGCQSLYLVLARNAQDEAELSSMDLVFYTAFYNSLLFAPLTLLELPDVVVFLQGPGEVSNLLQFLLPYVLLGAVLNFATFWCTAENSPLATAVAGTSKGVLSTVVGMLLFGAHLTSLGWIGLAGSTMGGFVYSLAHGRHSNTKSSKRTS